MVGIDAYQQLFPFSAATFDSSETCPDNLRYPWYRPLIIGDILQVPGIAHIQSLHN